MILFFVAACGGGGADIIGGSQIDSPDSIVAADASMDPPVNQQSGLDENRLLPSESASENLPEENLPAENQPEENQPEENQPEENLPEENLPVENQTEEDLPEENLPVANQPENDQPEESLAAENQPEENLSQESQPETSDEQVTQTFFNATAEDITDLVLVTGQSNALGAGTSFDEVLDAPNSQVLAYTNEGWQIADLHQIWDLDWFPRNDPNTPPSNNFSLHFGKRVVTQAPDRVVGFILVSSPGSPISHWDSDGEFFNEIRNRVSQAINELPFKSRLDGILWHQGESDGEDRDEYGDALYDLISRFRSEPWFADNLPFICGDTVESPVNNQLRRLNSDDDPWTACIEAEGLPIVDPAHFNAESLRIIGGRYADAYLNMYLGIR